MDDNKQPLDQNVEPTETTPQPEGSDTLDYSDFADEPLAQDFSTDTSGNQNVEPTPANTIESNDTPITQDYATDSPSEESALEPENATEPQPNTDYEQPLEEANINNDDYAEEPIAMPPETDTLAETEEAPTPPQEPQIEENNETLPADTTTNESLDSNPDYDSDSLMSEFGLDTDPEPNVEEADNLNVGGGTPAEYTDSPLAPPPSHPGGSKKMIALIAITLVLFVVLLASIWYFFLRNTGKPQGPEPTPTIQQQITPQETETHLECRFGLCVETPNVDGEDNSNQCSSSFDCEQAPSEPTATPTPGESISPTAGATIIPNPSGSPQVSNTPVPTMTTTPTPSPALTSTPTPTNIPTPTPTPLTSTLPESGSTETTVMLFSLMSIFLIGGGYLAFAKKI